MLTSITLNSNNDVVIIIDSAILIGRVLTDKEVHFAYMSGRLGHLWQPVKGVTIFPSSEGRFLFQFNHGFYAAKVLKGGPWLYDNCNLVVEKLPLVRSLKRSN